MFSPLLENSFLSNQNSLFVHVTVVAMLLASLGQRLQSEYSTRLASGKTINVNSSMKMKRYGVNVGETAFHSREKQSNLQIQRSQHGLQSGEIPLLVKSSKSPQIKHRVCVKLYCSNLNIIKNVHLTEQ